MDVLFFSPAWPPEMAQFTRGLAEVGARVWGVGDHPYDQLPGPLRRNLHAYLHVPRVLDEDDVIARVLVWLGNQHLDRIESNWEPTTLLAARLREIRGVPGMSVDTVNGFRDKPLMRERVAAAGLRIPKTARVRSAEEIRTFAAEARYPIIVKPVAGAGSADTWRIGSAAELETVLGRIGHLSEASCEEFVTGQELTYETICVDGTPVFESVSWYVPNVLEARKNEWISPYIFCLRDLSHPLVQGGLELGRKVIGALGMGTGFTHMEWFRKADGEAVFGEIACRPPGANMVDLMNYAADADLYREWARAVCWGAVELPAVKPYHAAIIFKRAQGQGRIVAHNGMDAFRQRHGAWIARDDLLPIGTPRRDWQQTFLADGNVVVRHPDWDPCYRMAEEFVRAVQLFAR